MLPVGHTLIDMLLLAAWINYGMTFLRNEKRSADTKLRVIPVVLTQDDGVPWDPRPMPPPPKFELLLTGTLPAGAVSISMRPECWWITRQKHWDPWWLLIHE